MRITRSSRWSLRIDAPPYDVVQHLHNCEARLHADPRGMVKRLGELAEVDVERLQLGPLPAPPPIPDQNGGIRYGWMDTAERLSP